MWFPFLWGSIPDSHITFAADQSPLRSTYSATSRPIGLGADWSRVNAIDVYTVHSLDAILPECVLNRAGASAVHGIRWHYTRPPITEFEFEMDLRGVRTELHLE